MSDIYGDVVVTLLKNLELVFAYFNKLDVSSKIVFPNP